MGDFFIIETPGVLRGVRKRTGGRARPVHEAIFLLLAPRSHARSKPPRKLCRLKAEEEGKTRARESTHTACYPPTRMPPTRRGAELRIDWKCVTYFGPWRARS